MAKNLVDDTSFEFVEGAEKAEHEALEARMDTAEDNISDLQTRMATAEDDVESLEGRMNTAENDIDSAESNISNLQGRMNTAENDIDSAESNISNLQGRMNTAENDIDSAESNISNLQGRMTTAEGNITSLQTRMSAVETKASNALTRTQLYSGAANSGNIALSGNITDYRFIMIIVGYAETSDTTIPHNYHSILAPSYGQKVALQGLAGSNSSSSNYSMLIYFTHGTNNDTMNISNLITTHPGYVYKVYGIGKVS